MSSMRNAVQRRNHKERAQPLEREKWGLLEKRKDYKLRAANHREKKQKLKALKEKILEKNPDEFSFKMMSSTVDKAGRKVTERGNKALSMDVVRLLKTQDIGYIRTMLQMVRKERKDIEEKIMLEDKEIVPLAEGKASGKKGKHTVFVGDQTEQQTFEADEWFGKGAEIPGDKKESVEDSEDDDDEPASKPKKLTKKQQETKLIAEKAKKALERQRERTKERMIIHLEAVKNRERELLIAEDELEKQRGKMNNTVGGMNKAGVKFKVRERKR